MKIKDMSVGLDSFGRLQFACICMKVQGRICKDCAEVVLNILKKIVEREDA